MVSRAVLIAAGMLAMPALADTGAGGWQGGLTVDRLELQKSALDNTLSQYWHADGWIGDDKNRVLLKTEGAHAHGLVSSDLTQVLYGRSVTESWFLELGAAHTGAPGPAQNWLALTAEGELPLSIDSEWMLFFGKNNLAWLRTQFETAVPVSGAWEFVPKLELNFYTKNDPANEIGSGFSNSELSLRLAYHLDRNVRGYVGYSRFQTYGNTATRTRIGGNSTFDNLLMTGIMVTL